ncbi:MAG: hypothetical protein IKW39_01270 [Alphaproteobacteria bacterium]|nr:hypothetical protein [Alphaproteobacteria bacterium]
MKEKSFSQAFWICCLLAVVSFILALFFFDGIKETIAWCSCGIFLVLSFIGYSCESAVTIPENKDI